MKLVIGGVAQGKLDYVLENMIEESEKYDVYDCFFLKDNACNDKAANMEWPWATEILEKLFNNID